MVRRSQRLTPYGIWWPADWEGNIRTYWEVPSKRWSIEFAVKNLFAKDPIAIVKPTTSTIDFRFRY